MKRASSVLTLDSNVLIAALKKDDPHSKDCSEILSRVPDEFVLSEPSIVYQEVCGTLARKVGLEVAAEARKYLDQIIHPNLLINCNKNFCVSAYALCREYDVYAIDGLYLKVALESHAALVSLDREDFINRVNRKKPSIRACHASEFPS
jgi:predicted nucleic acid-binding protein